MNSDFNLFIFSEDVNFSSALALECNKYGFELTFFEINNMKEIFNNNKNSVSVVIIDLENDLENEKLKLGEKSRIISNFPIFGVLDRINKNIQHKSKDYGFDLIFTKRMLLKSLKKVVVHVSNQ